MLEIFHHLVNVFKLCIVAGDSSLARHIGRQSVRRVQIKKVNKNKDGLVPVSLQPLAGGVGVIHRNFDPEGQAAQVRQVKKYESGMVVNPLTIGPDAMLSDAMALMKDHGSSGIPVVTGASKGVPGKLVGILTNRDVRFATDPKQKINDLMTTGTAPDVSRMAPMSI